MEIGPENSPESNGKDQSNRELWERRRKSLEDGSAESVSASEWAEAALSDPEIRLKSNLHEAWRSTMYERFEELFLSSGLSAADLAMKAGVSSIVIQALLEQRAYPRRTALEKLAVALDKSETYFLEDSAA